MIAFLLPMILTGIAFISAIALADSALRWASAYRRLYPSTSKAYKSDLATSCRPRPIRQAHVSTARPIVKSQQLTRAAA